MAPRKPIRIDPQRRTVAVGGVETLGEALMAVPSLREIRRHHEGVRLLLVAPASIANLLRTLGETDDSVTWKTDALRRREIRGTLRLWKSVRRKKPDVFLVFRTDLQARLTGFASGARHRIGHVTGLHSPLLTRNVRLPEELRRFHQVYLHLQLLHESGLSPVNYLREPQFRPDLRVPLTESLVQTAREALAKLGVDPRNPLIGLFAGSAGSSAGRWLPERYAAVLRKLRHRIPFNVILFGARGDRPIADLVIQECDGANLYNACGTLGLVETAALIAACRLFIGTDSGMMHLAAAFDVPQVALFGPTDPVIGGPFSTRAVSLRKNICGPCFTTVCPIDRRCMKAVTMEEVVKRARELLQKEYSPDV